MMSLDFIMDFESGEATLPEIVDNFAEGIRDGSVWGLQGMYGRTARDLIDQGYISEDGEVLIELEEIE